MEEFRELLRDLLRQKPKIIYGPLIGEVMVLLADYSRMDKDPFVLNLEGKDALLVACPGNCNVLALKKRIVGMTTIPEYKVMLFYGGSLMQDYDVSRMSAKCVYLSVK
jgi:hypothetical protein